MANAPIPAPPIALSPTTGIPPSPAFTKHFSILTTSVIELINLHDRINELLELHTLSPSERIEGVGLVFRCRETIWCLSPDTAVPEDDLKTLEPQELADLAETMKWLLMKQEKTLPLAARLAGKIGEYERVQCTPIWEQTENSE